MRPATIRSSVVPGLVAVIIAVIIAGLLSLPVPSSQAAVAPTGAVVARAAVAGAKAHADHHHMHHKHQKKRTHKHRHHRPKVVRIGTYNLRADMGMRKFRSGIRAIRRHAGVVGLQEIGSNQRRHYLTSSRKWGYFRPQTMQQNPVIWNRHRFRFVHGKGHRVAKSRHLLNQLPGSHKRKKDSTATVVRLRHRQSGRNLSIINVHLVHGAVKGGRPWPHRPRVFGLYVDQVGGLVRTVKRERRWGRVFVVGDFNVGYKADAHERRKKLPYRRLTRLHLNSMWQGSRYLHQRRGTHNDALIDQVWSKRKPRHARILRRIQPSDHFPAVATYRLKSARRHR